MKYSMQENQAWPLFLVEPELDLVESLVFHGPRRTQLFMLVTYRFLRGRVLLCPFGGNVLF